MNMIKCTKCGSIKEAKYFYSRTSRSNGKASWCKACSKDYAYKRTAATQQKEAGDVADLRAELEQDQEFKDLLITMGK